MAEEPEKWWKVINIDKRENLHQGDVSGFGEIFSSGCQLVELLKNPTWLEFKIPSHIIQASKQKSRASPLISLPQEIIELVTKDLYDNGESDAIMCLGMTCTYFFRLLANNMQKLIQEDVGQWRKHRLMFIAPDAPGFSTELGTADEEAEWNELEKISLYNMTTRTAQSMRPMDGPLQRLWTHIFSPLFSVYGRQITRVLEIMHKRGDNDSMERFKRLLMYLAQIPKSIKREQTQPILRNLVTKEYIRGEPLGIDQHPRNLGEALLCFCMWSGDVALDPDIPASGRWVGHRFDIAMAVTVEGDEEWTDVTMEALNRLCVSGNERIYWFITRGTQIFSSEMTALAAQMGNFGQ